MPTHSISPLEVRAHSEQPRTHRPAVSAGLQLRTPMQACTQRNVPPCSRVPASPRACQRMALRASWRTSASRLLLSAHSCLQIGILARSNPFRGCEACYAVILLRRIVRGTASASSTRTSAAGSRLCQWRFILSVTTATTAPCFVEHTPTWNPAVRQRGARTV